MIGTKLAHYQITAHLGSGGMGDVYQAADSKLGRSVAIKFLPEAFNHDAERVARFEREARVLASLNHPNIAAIYGFEQSASHHFLVMELVPGETLAERIRRGPIRTDEAFAIANQICDALEAAHEKGVVHRDLKPANVKVTPEGTVKVLDFGLAKAFETDAPDAASSNSPTLSMAATKAGVILGTAAYMSPEQAKGLTVDRRTDIFAFGALLYEMLTGRQAFQGETVGDIVAAVIRAEPDWTRLPSDALPSIRRLLRLCLQKDAKKRRQTATDVRIDIEQALAEPAAEAVPLSPGEGAPTASGLAGRVRAAWFAATLATATAVAFAIPYFRSAPPAPPETRVEINTPATSDPVSFALSPDGRQIVFVASSDGASRLWLRSLASTTAQPLAGTEGAAYPFWSPDSRSVGFVADNRLKRLDIGGGAPQTLATANAARGGTWNADGIILFTTGTSSPLFRVPASGGEAVAVTKLDRQSSHRFPSFLSDGRQFLFYAQGTPETGGMYLGALDSTETQRLTTAETAGVYLSLRDGGWLLWVRTGTLVAQRLDLEQKALTGDSVTLADPVAFDANNGSAVSVSARGLVAYRTGAASRRQLAWFDRSGKALGAMGAPDENGLTSPSVSPDGRRVAVHRTVQGNADIWLLDGTRTNRFTFDAALDRWPVWSPDGSRIVFDSNRKGPRDLYQKPSSGAGEEELLVESAQIKVANNWSADGRFVFYHSIDPQAGRDLWVLPMEGDRKPWVFLNTGFEERHGQFSPDGRWVAYESNESGRNEIYIRPFSEPAASGAVANSAAGQWQISTAGGIFPKWRADGKELYYIGPNGEMMAAPIAATVTTMEPGAPVALFPTRIFGGGVDSGQGPQYDVARDGRFLVNTVLDDASSPITLIQNWSPPAP